MAGMTLTVAAGQEMGHLRPRTVAPEQKVMRPLGTLQIGA